MTCQNNCFSFFTKFKAFFNNQPPLKTQLALLYKQKYYQTIFYEVAISTLRYITNDPYNPQSNQQDQQEPFQRKSTRKSSKSVSHYQNATISFNSDSKQQNNQIPSTLAYMSVNQKQQLLKQLIEKSYLFIDLTDLFSGQDLQTYQNIVKQQIFQGEQSIVQSILQTAANKKNLKNRLKYFDTGALSLLKDYVAFCDKITLKLKPFQQYEQKSAKDEFLSRLILQLKAHLQLQFVSQKMTGRYSDLNKLVEQFKIMSDIILTTLQKTQSIKIIPQSSHEYAQNFYTYPNISTLISVILFMDDNFLKAIFDRFSQGLKVCIGRMGQKLNIIQKKFLQDLKNQYFGMPLDKNILNKTNNIYYRTQTKDLIEYESNLSKIINGRNEIKIKYFRKSLRTLQTLTVQKQPLKCLKIIYQLNKTIQKQHTQFINAIINQQIQLQKNTDTRLSRSQQMRNSKMSKKYSFSRQTQINIIEYLLSQKRDKLRFIVTNIMITHFFIHPSQLKDKKGSCLAPFVDIIKNLGFAFNFQ